MGCEGRPGYKVTLRNTAKNRDLTKSFDCVTNEHKKRTTKYTQDTSTGFRKKPYRKCIRNGVD